MLEPAFLTLPAAIQVVGSAILGAIVGSFLGAALERLPKGRSIVTGRSACDGCGKALTVAELVPVLSWLLQKGKCRTCGERIGNWQLACELGGAGVGIASILLVPNVQALTAMLLGWQLLLLGLLDLRHLWLPRLLVGWLAASGLIVAFAKARVTDDAAVLGISIAGGAFGFLLLWLIARFYLKARGRDGMGSGDPPLLGAIGLWIGPLGVVEAMLGASILGIAAAIVMLVSKRKIDADTALPLGTCLAATAWPIFLLQGLG
jgi:leader peptidase (prepilin peptidase)/N-methyltransferase